jgi:ABC-2 type transport system permease protein/sodium transport system permease protein
MTMPPHTSPGQQGAARLLRLARKELTEILRDRRTIITLLVMPVLLYPLLTLAFRLFSLGGKVAEEQQSYRLAFASKTEQEVIGRYLRRGWEAQARGAAIRLPPPGVDVYPDIDDAVRSAQAEVGLRFAPNGGGGDWELVYLEDSALSREAAQYVQQLAAAADAEGLRDELAGQKVKPRPRVRFAASALKAENRPGLSLTVFVPLVLILMTITGAVYPAIDLTAGERERGTLDLLLAAPVPRVSLLFGKYVAVVVVAVLTALVNLGSMTVSLLLSGLSERVFGPEGLRLLTLLEVFGLVLLFAAFFSAVLLVLTSFARSFKEAQAYLIPLMVVALLPGIVGLLPGLPLSGPLAVVPLLNIVLLARDLLAGHADPVEAAVVVIVTAVYAVLAVAVAARVFGAEGVLYGGDGGWRALLRRRTQA